MDQQPVRTTAAPVDAFVRVNPAADSLNRLAEGLSQVAPSLLRYSDTLAQKQMQEQSEAGKQKASDLYASGVKFRDAVKRGDIRPDQNPWFQVNFKEQMGRLAAENYRAQLTTMLDTTLQGEVDPSKFDQTEQQARKSFLETNAGDNAKDPYFQHGFANVAAADTAAARNQFAERAGAIMTQQSIDNLQQYTSALYENNRKGGIDLDTTARQIESEVKRLMLTNPLAGTKAIRAVADGLIAQATDPNDADPNALELLKRVKGANGQLIANIGDVKDKINAASNEIPRIQQQQFERIKQQNAYQKQRFSEDVKQNAIEQLSHDPHADIEPFVKSLAMNGDDAGVEQLKKLRNVISGNDFDSDKNVVNNLYTGIWKGNVDESKILNTLNGVDANGRHSLNLRDARELMTTLREYNKENRATAGENWQRILTDPELTRALEAGKASFGGNSLGGFDTTEHAQAYNAWQVEMTNGWIQRRTGQGNIKPTAQQIKENLDYLYTQGTESIPRFLLGGTLGSIDVKGASRAPRPSLDTSQAPYKQQFYLRDENTLKGFEQKIATQGFTENDKSLLKSMGVDLNSPAQIIDAIVTQRRLWAQAHKPTAKTP